MLNKEICKKCINDDADSIGFTSWSILDENAWNRGEVLFCWMGANKTSDNPPKRCKYKIEQIIVENNNEKTNSSLY